jgi:hypothetical protein
MDGDAIQEQYAHMGKGVERLMMATLLPLSFFLLARRIIGTLVSEKEKGILEFLQMNGMNETAYNLSFIWYETFFIGPAICSTLNFLVWWRCFYDVGRPFEMYFAKSLLRFNVGICFFVEGITALCILISKAFSTTGFAS